MLEKYNKSINSCQKMPINWNMQQNNAQQRSQSEGTTAFLASQTIARNQYCKLKYIAERRRAMQPSGRKKGPLKRARKSVCYIGLYSNTPASHAAKSPKRNFTLTSKSKQRPMARWQETTNFLTCQNMPYNQCVPLECTPKQPPSHATKWQETTTFLACQKISENQILISTSKTKQRPAMQPSGRTQHIFHQATNCPKIDMLN